METNNIRNYDEITDNIIKPYQLRQRKIKMPTSDFSQSIITV